MAEINPDYLLENMSNEDFVELFTDGGEVTLEWLMDVGGSAFRDLVRFRTKYADAVLVKPYPLREMYLFGHMALCGPKLTRGAVLHILAAFDLGPFAPAP